ncbi:putative dimethyladenosine transferase [Astathelohania contejeani]|uniref:rRNA adenine N(6)-methyltransferase n=1 Tax=Astathelohania contejeani TaxID=164912 RepID=A0ABQ7HWX6_9MICR|nr:putative dimethyladenosine transferase [Thelohania contejeani]
MGNPKFNTKIGQHILKNPGIIDALIEKAKVKPTDVILEIGGGTGNLTIKLLQRAKRVICYEKDPRLAAELMKRVEAQPELSHKLKLIVGDALEATFPYFDMCISNTPYQISSPLVFKLLNYNFKCAYLMFQREFAERLTARVGLPAYSRLSVAVQISAQVDHIMKVGKNNFNPPPKVESSIVRIEPKYPKPPIDLTEFNGLLQMCFLRKNKTLSAVFKGNTISKNMYRVRSENENSEEEIREILHKTNMGNKRASKLEIEDFLLLLLEFKKSGFGFKSDKK